MDKKMVRTVISIVLGIAVFTIIATVISLIFEASLIKNAIDITVSGESAEKVVDYVQGSSIGVVFVAAATLTCYCLTYFIKNKKIFGIISAVLSLFLVAMCIGFIFDLSEVVNDLGSSTSYTIASAYFTELITLIIACLITCAYFTVITVREFISQKTDAQTEKLVDNTEAAVNEKVGESDEKN